MASKTHTCSKCSYIYVYVYIFIHRSVLMYICTMYISVLCLHMYIYATYIYMFTNLYTEVYSCIYVGICTHTVTDLFKNLTFASFQLFCLLIREFSMKILLGIFSSGLKKERKKNKVEFSNQEEN